MASEAVKILIEAEDLASAKVAQAAAKIDQNVKKIKDVGKNAKASTEFIGQLAGQLGGSEIGAFAGQLGGLTEKISQFSEVSKLGGAGAMAFKAGLVGVVAALSYNIGKSIGDIVFETERWNKELADAITLQDRLNAKLRDFAAERMKSQAAEVSAIEDPAKQLEAIERVNKAYDDQALSIGKTIAEMEKQKSKIDDFDEFVLGGFVKTASEFEREEIDRNIAAQKEMLQTIRDQQIAFAKNVEEQRNARIEAEEKAKVARDESVLKNLEQELALLQANEEEARKLKAQYAGLTGQAADRAVELMKQADAERQVQEERKRIEAEQKSNEEKMIQGLLKRIELEDSLNQAIELRKIALEKGEEAARAASLQNQGLIEETAKRIAAEEAALSKLEQEKKAKEQNRQNVTPNLQATEMRLLRFGGGNEQRQIAQATQASQKHLEFIAKLTAEREAREARAPRPAKVQDIRFKEVS